MGSLVKESSALYVCSCGLLNPLSKLYFCRHCVKLRCDLCVWLEVDSLFCSHCLENIPSSEARQKKNRCNNCFDCPSCHHTLSARATSQSASKKSEETQKKETVDGKGDAKSGTPRRMHYLICLACRWTSRDVGIRDQPSPTGTWPESEYAHHTRFSSILGYYQAVVQQEKQEKQEYWRRKQHKFPSLTDHTGLTVSMVRRQIGWPNKTQPKPKTLTINPSLPSEDVEALPESIFSENINLKNITTIEQRHGQPADQPYAMNKLYPQHKNLWIKRSVRCRQCERNIIKAEYHPGSIKFRIQLIASYHVPDVQLEKCEKPLKAGELNVITLRLTNLTVHDMPITLTDLPTEEEELQMIEEFKKEKEKQTSLTTNTGLNPSLSRQASVTEEPKLVDKKITASLVLPDSQFVLIHRDDSSEFDDDVHDLLKEDPKFVIWRKLNKVSIQLNFTPNADLKEGEEVIIGFSMHYPYTHTATNSPDRKDLQQQTLVSRVYVKVGTT